MITTIITTSQEIVTTITVTISPGTPITTIITTSPEILITIITVFQESQIPTVATSQDTEIIIRKIKTINLIIIFPETIIITIIDQTEIWTQEHLTIIRTEIIEDNPLIQR